VRPVWEEGICAISTAGGRDAKGILTNPVGVRYFDGRVAPSFDWETKPRPTTGAAAKRNESPR
jgi:hypothetical protein